MLDLLAEAMVEAIYEGKAKGYLLDAYPMNLEQVRYREACIKYIFFELAFTGCCTLKQTKKQYFSLSLLAKLCKGEFEPHIICFKKLLYLES